MIGKFLRQYLESKPLTIVGSGEQRRDFTYVKDIVNANVMAAIYSRNKKNFGEVYNVGSGINFSINEVAKMISNNVVNVSTREGESNITLADTKKILHSYSWKPKYHLKEWLEKQVFNKKI